MLEKIKTVELNDEDLEKVSGGTIHSSDTYVSLGINCAQEHDQQPNYHPVITTIFNSCKLSDATCLNCLYHAVRGVTFYCKARSQEVDKGK